MTSRNSPAWILATSINVSTIHNVSPEKPMVHTNASAPSRMKENSANSKVSLNLSLLCIIRFYIVNRVVGHSFTDQIFT